jgi:hypothetical protein
MVKKQFFTADTQRTQRLRVFLFSVERTENKKKRIAKIVILHLESTAWFLNCRLSRQFKKIYFFASSATLR